MQFMTENLPSSRQSGEHLNNLPLFLGDQDVSYQLYGLVSLWAAALLTEHIIHVFIPISCYFEGKDIILGQTRTCAKFKITLPKRID